MQQLFVYGSLAPGRSHHHLLSKLRGRWQPATVRGQLYPQGRWATRGWPAMKPDPHGAVINGWLLTSPDLARHWQTLDNYEGPFYRRIKCPVQLADGRIRRAWLYRQR